MTGGEASEAIEVQSDDVAAALRAAGLQTRADTATRSMYASDASLYRVPPLAVVRPRSADDVAAVLAVAREVGTSVTARGAGTSIAGNAIGPGIVLDFSRHLNRVLAIDPEARTADVEPGVVHAALQRELTPYGLRFGPDPSTHTRCTIGGMIGNNACGARSLAYGRTSDNVVGLQALTGSGAPVESVAGQLRTVMAGHLATARTEFDRFGRQVSGYAAQHLLPERFDLTRALIGSEGTLAVVTRATVRLVPVPRGRVVVVLGFPDILTAAAAAPDVVAHGPSSCEGLDDRLLDVLRSRGRPVPDLPRGTGWLLVEFAGDDAGQVRDRAQRLAAAFGDAQLVSDPAAQARLWRIREDGAGLAGRSPAGKPAWPGWEDAAVPPDKLAAYLARFDELVAAHGLSAAPYGHFGDGCVHVRLDFPFEAGTRVFTEFLTASARLVAEFGGSLSGEHGDGRARSALLPLMYSAAALEMFAQIKNVFDPDNRLNPGVLVDPRPVAADVRPAGRFPLPRLGFAYSDDHGDLPAAVHRCTGVGKCRAQDAGVMCPSYLATREEKDSTRGRARVLQDVIRGELSWRDPAVDEALDLCLSCKGCASDCPTGVDMATYKSEWLQQKYRHRLRPRTHYALGQLPRWARWAGRLPRLANLATRLPGAMWLAGVDRRRSVPALAARTFRRTFVPAASDRRPVVLFVDSFTDAFAPHVAQAAVRVLRAAGYEPRLPPEPVCCALTWITTGQLDAAKRLLTRTTRLLAEAARGGVPVVGLEPSCTAVLRSDARELLPDNEDAVAVGAATRTLAELLAATPEWTPPDRGGTNLVVQPHCHHHAVLGFGVDAAILAATGATIETVAGCCGLAGNFGVERGHYDVSVAVAARNLLPAVGRSPDATVLADGFSCRTQLADLAGRTGRHLAELLDPELER